MIKKFIEEAGWPRVIIGLFLLSLFITAPFVGVRVDTSLSDTLVRFGMNAVMVLAMIPMVQSGCGLNFGLPLGIIAGLLGATLSIELHEKVLAWAAQWVDVTVFGAPVSFASAVLMALPIAAVLGWLYGQLLNRVKGDEMMIAT